MKQLLVFLLISTFLSLTGCNQALDHLGIHLKINEYQLSNGLTVILVEDHTVPVVSYQTWYRVGSVDEYPGITGMSHLFEHLMFKGTEKYGPKQFFEQLETRGAEVNAFTTRDYTVFYENFGKDLLEKVIDMESDRMTHLILNEGMLEHEKRVVFEERRLRGDNSPDVKIQEVLWQLAYHYHPYQWPVIGIPFDLPSINFESLQSYHQAYYQPSNATVVVVGDFAAGSTYAWIKKYYDAASVGKSARAKPERKVRSEPDQTEERRIVLRERGVSERFSHAYHVSSADNLDSYALDVLANILFEGVHSRASRYLIEEKDLVIGITGSAYTPTYPGLFIISGTMKGRLSSEIAERALDRVIGKLQDRGPTEEEVRTAVKQLMVQWVDSVQTPYGLGQWLGTIHMIFGNLKRIKDDVARYEKVTAADVQRVARQYLIPNNRSVVILAPEEPVKATPEAKTSSKKK